ncbi:MAG: ATP-binding protein [Candidatus Nanohaloarchaea archaeon]
MVAGNKAIIHGVLKTKDIYKSKKTPLFNKYIEAKSIEVIEKEFKELEIDEETKEKIKQISKKPNVLGEIAESVAPSIYGYKPIKKALALQLTSGRRKTLPDNSTRRGDIHIFLVGDPAIGKSQLARYMQQISPKGRYASGKSATGAGITAAAHKGGSGLTNEGWTIEAGALPLADGGLACIDELDKMDRKDRSAMHEALSQQRISIAKAGITTTLQSRCAVLGVANPEQGRFDEYTPVGEQIDIDAALLSRFDLIFTLTDEVDEERDAEIANHINKAHSNNGESKEIEPKIGPELLRHYISYAKQKEPQLTKEASQQMKDFYVDMRQTKSSSEEDAVPITARKYESMLRIAEASARLRLSDKITERDAETAIEIVKFSLEQVGINPETGEFDADIIETGVSSTQREKNRKIRQIVNEKDEENAGARGADKEEVIQEAINRGLFDTKQEVEEFIEKMKEDTLIMEPRMNKTLKTT